MENYYVTNSPHCLVYTSFYPFENFLFWKLKCQGMQIRLQQEHRSRMLDARLFRI